MRIYAQIILLFSLLFFSGQSIFAHKQAKENQFSLKTERLRPSELSFPKSFLNDLVEDNTSDLEEDNNSSENEIKDVDLTFISKLTYSPFDFFCLSFYQYFYFEKIDKTSNFPNPILENLPPIFISKSALII